MAHDGVLGIRFNGAPNPQGRNEFQSGLDLYSCGSTGMG
jgi:hypothetical protein